MCGCVSSLLLSMGTRHVQLQQIPTAQNLQATSLTLQCYFASLASITVMLMQTFGMSQTRRQPCLVRISSVEEFTSIKSLTHWRWGNLIHEVILPKGCLYPQWIIRYGLKGYNLSESRYFSLAVQWWVYIFQWPHRPFLWRLLGCFWSCSFEGK